MKVVLFLNLCAVAHSATCYAGKYCTPSDTCMVCAQGQYRSGSAEFCPNRRRRRASTTNCTACPPGKTNNPVASRIYRDTEADCSIELNTPAPTPYNFPTWPLPSQPSCDPPFSPGSPFLAQTEWNECVAAAGKYTVGSGPYACCVQLAYAFACNMPVTAYLSMEGFGCLYGTTSPTPSPVPNQGTTSPTPSPVPNHGTTSPTPSPTPNPADLAIIAIYQLVGFNISSFDTATQQALLDALRSIVVNPAGLVQLISVTAVSVNATRRLLDTPNPTSAVAAQVAAYFDTVEALALSQEMLANTTKVTAALRTTTELKNAIILGNVAVERSTRADVQREIAALNAPPTRPPTPASAPTPSTSLPIPVLVGIACAAIALLLVVTRRKARMTTVKESDGPSKLVSDNQRMSTHQSAVEMTSDYVDEAHTL